MKTNYLTAVVLGLLTALSGCQAEDDTPHTPQGNIPVGFSGDVPQTRAAKEYESAADLTDIGVFAYFTNGAFSKDSSTPNFMYNQQVERQGDGSWTYSPVKYWPGNTTDKISFFAYAPYVDEAATGGSNPTLSSNGAKGFPTLSYTVPSAENNQVDLLAAVPLMNQGYADNSGTVKFRLKHAMTKVGVYVKSNDNVAGKKVTAFSITSAKSGTLTYHAPAASDADDTGTEWTYSTPVATETFTATATDFAVPDSKVAEKKLLSTFFLLPRGEGSTFSITYTTPGETSSGAAIMQTVSLTGQPLPSLEIWTQGTFVTYTIGIEKKQITVTAATHPAWTDGGTGTVTGSVIITYAASPDNPGWGNGGTGTVDGQPVITHSEQGTPPSWNEGSSGTVDGTEKTD